jgi:hypothetical protein
MATEDKAVTPYERVRLYTELHTGCSLGDEILFDRRFKTAPWPRTGYALEQADVVAVLDELVLLREELARAKEVSAEVGEKVQRMVALHNEYVATAEREIEGLEAQVREGGGLNDD